MRQVPTYRGKGGGLFCLKIEKSALCLKTNALIVFIFDISHSHLEYYLIVPKGKTPKSLGAVPLFRVL